MNSVPRRAPALTADRWIAIAIRPKAARLPVAMRLLSPL
jgi:hypothetical protein